jgi:flagellar hook-associated protein 3 FlgL
MLSRIGTFSSASALLTASLKVQAKMADQQAQEASGLKSTTFSGVSQDAGKLLDLSGQSARLSADSAAATAAGSVVQAAYSAVSNISDLATTIRSQLAASLSGGSAANTSSALAQSASDWLSSLQNELNTEVGGVYVFGGQATDTAPVNFDDPYYVAADTPDTVSTQYFQGSSTARTLTTSTGMSVGLSVPANSSGFELLARALSVLAAAPSDQASQQSAYDMVGQAVTALTESQATISNQASTLDSLVSNNAAKITALNNLGTTLDGADLATAAVLVTQYDSQLEALYSSISKLTSSSLLKYL